MKTRIEYLRLSNTVFALQVSADICNVMEAFEAGDTRVLATAHRSAMTGMWFVQVPGYSLPIPEYTCARARAVLGRVVENMTRTTGDKLSNETEL